LKKSTKIAIISGIAVAIVVSVLAVIIHIKQSAIEVTEKGNESTSQKINEVINAVTNQNSSAAIPSITLSSSRTSAGSIIAVSGTGFAQSAPVKITLPDGSIANITTSPGTYFSTLGISGEYGTDNAHFGYPEGVTVDSSGNIYVVDRGNDRVQKFSSSGKYMFTLGVLGKSDTDNSHFNTPVSLALDSAGNIYVADTYNHRIQKFSSNGSYISTLGVAGKYGSDNSHFSYPESVALDSTGNIYVADTYNHRIQKFSSNGSYISTLGISGEFGTDNAHLCYPASVTVDSYGNIYVADSGNNRVQKFSSSGVYLSTLGTSGPYMSTAGMASKSYTGNSDFRTPENVALDSFGNIYVADTYNHRIQKFSSNGIYLSTLGIAGKYGSDNAHFGYPASVAIDSSGNIYVADFDNNRVQKFAPTGSFEKYVTIPSVALGTYVISATDGKNSASAGLSLVSQEMAVNEPVPTYTVSAKASNTPAFYLLSHGISVKDAIQKASGPVNASNTFAFFLLSNIVQNDTGNIFFSPYSISDAFSMAYEGARGQTESEIQSVFGFADRQTQRESIKEVDSKLNSPKSNYTLNIANAMWVQKNFPILQEYFDSLQNYYSAKAENLDFIANPDGSRIVINKWVENKTAEKIKDLLPKGSIDAGTRLVLTDAVYFKGTWLTKFAESKTKDADFSLSDNSTVKVPMMHVETGFKYLEDGDLKILDMPYSGGNLSMMVILPKDKNLNHLISILSSDKLNQWNRSLAVKDVSVHMPKFMLHTNYKLKDNLREMGMPSAFDCELADFSGIDGYKTSCFSGNLYIDQVYHKAFVDVDEKGTEAAAATAIVSEVVMGENAGVQPLEFNADHPFVFLIHDKKTGLVLFAGQVVNPLAG
jgi:serpin B